MEISEDIGHLSIGEVLSLLQSEFPDITISKIRFLEAQGLIDPERTPSGYRKFYDLDIARLRWILHQQRDNFLPLKVIKARLEHGDVIDFDAPISVQPNLWSDESAGRSEPAPAEAERPALWAPVAPAAGSSSRPSTVPGNAQIAAAGDPDPVGARSATRSPQGPPPDAAAPAVTRPVSGAGDLTAVAAAAETAAGDPADDATERDSAAWLAALQENPRRNPPSRPTEPTAITVGRGVRFGRDEVIEVTGVSEDEIELMITYGLLTPVSIGGEDTFDASSVAVVRSVARFLDRGVEPRHLRMFKNSAEREAGFYEQMILPLLKQRNPKARDQAVASLVDLVAAGEELSRSLVRQALRAHLGE